MIKLFEWLFYGHSHKWKIIDTRGVLGKNDDGQKALIGERYTLQCEHCGNIKFTGK